MTSRGRALSPAVLAGLLIIAPGLQGCVATAVAGATLGVAGAAVKVTAVTVGTTAKVAGGAVHLAANAGRHPPKKKPPPPQ
jgi:hypothetical protein